MKSILLLMGLCTMILATNLQADVTKNSRLTWYQNYEQAVNQAQAESKFLVLFFTWTGNCSWCTKLEEEVLSTPEFADAVGNKLIFVKVDYSSEPQYAAQNDQLKKKYNIRGYPTLVVLDPHLQQVGVTGYRPGGGKQYASYLFDMINNFKNYKQNMQGIGNSTLSGLELRKLLEKAHEFNQDADANQIVKAGLQSDQRLFFLTERYRRLVDEGQTHDPEAVAIRQQLLASDPENGQHTHYEIAVIDFEALCDGMSKDNASPFLTVAPLVAYIERFGSKDKENIWRLQMLISQVFLDKNQFAEALKYAQSAYESAPQSLKPELATAVKNIQTYLNNVSAFNISSLTR